MMARRTREAGRGPFESFKVLFRQQHVLAVIGQQHSLAADEQAGVVPLRDSAGFPNLRFVLTLMPGELYWRQCAARAVLVCRAHGSGRDLRMRRGAARPAGGGRAPFERPERESVPVGGGGGPLASTVSCACSLSAQKGRSFQWLPRSLIVPLPKSHQRYHFGPEK